VIVLSYRNERTIGAALESLLGQGEPLEIVVSHSGGGDTPALLRERFPDIHVDAAQGRRTPGAARNAGVVATRAPFVSFHAGDSLALPGWAAGRLELHRRGARVVGSAIAPPRGLAPLAAHVLLHSTRMPHVTPGPHLRFGASYTREVLEQYGPFPERMDGEEDVELNERLIRAGVPVEWAPGVMTAPEYAESSGELIANLYRRGGLRYRCRGHRRQRGILAARALLDGPSGLMRAARPESPVRPAELARSAPLVIAGSVAAAGGILSAPRA
jgi:glycosyltransferase involved in cell wall biosynthesis